MSSSRYPLRALFLLFLENKLAPFTASTEPNQKSTCLGNPDLGKLARHRQAGTKTVSAPRHLTLKIKPVECRQSTARNHFGPEAPAALNGLSAFRSRSKVLE